MRPALYHRESGPPAKKPMTPAAPTDIAAHTMICDDNASPIFATQIAQDRYDVRRHPAQAPILLRSRMSDHG